MGGGGAHAGGSRRSVSDEVLAQALQEEEYKTAGSRSRLSLLPVSEERCSVGSASGVDEFGDLAGTQTRAEISKVDTAIT